MEAYFMKKAIDGFKSQQSLDYTEKERIEIAIERDGERKRKSENAELLTLKVVTYCWEKMHFMQLILHN